MNTEITLVSGLVGLLCELLRLLSWAVILAAIVSTLISFGVLDRRNRAVWTVADFLNRVSDPVCRPVRNALPDFGGVDLSPLVVLLVINYIAIPLLIDLQNGILFGQW